MTREKTAKAQENPTKKFDHPLEVLRAEGLSIDEKIAVLQSWEDEAHQLLKATEENMVGGEPSRIDEIRKALDLAQKEKIAAPRSAA